MSERDAAEDGAAITRALSPLYEPRGTIRNMRMALRHVPTHLLEDLLMAIPEVVRPWEVLAMHNGEVTAYVRKTAFGRYAAKVVRVTKNKPRRTAWAAWAEKTEDGALYLDPVGDYLEADGARAAADKALADAGDYVLQHGSVRPIPRGAL